MRDLKNKLTSSKNTKNIQIKKGKSFGYQVLGFGAGAGRNVTDYIIATGGTITTVDTDYKVHTFTGPGPFNVTNEGTPAGSTKVDYLIIGGGGAGGGAGVGGGGAGGNRTSYPSAAGVLTMAYQNYPVTVGGGASGTTGGDQNGSNSVFDTITSAGGGGGKGSDGAGGSGGGGSRDNSPGGVGNSPPVSPPQGRNGGTGIFAAPQYGGGRWWRNRWKWFKW
jgi:hypothetical protein